MTNGEKPFSNPFKKPTITRIKHVMIVKEEVACVLLRSDQHTVIVLRSGYEVDYYDDQGRFFRQLQEKFGDTVLAN